MNTSWQPYREPLRTTLLRTVTIALVLGGGFASWRGGLAYWPRATLLMLWPSLGGHWVELGFLNWLRPRIPPTRPIQIIARLAVWFLGGCVLFYAMRLTAAALNDFTLHRWPQWWIGGLAFIGIELLAHLGLLLRGRPNFYDGRG